MSAHTFNILCTETIVIVIILILVRFKTVVAFSLPFVLFVLVGWFNDTLSHILIATIRSNVINSNVYWIVENLLLIWLFKEWNVPPDKKNLYQKLAVVGLALWIADNLILHSLTTFNDGFRLWHSLTVVVLSVRQINSLLFKETRSLFRNPMFIISIAMVIFYSFAAIIEVFYLVYPYGNWNFFLSKIFNSLNLLSNILFTVAVLRIPKKETLQLAFR